MKQNIMLEGPVGAGKTHVLRTIIENTNKNLIVIPTEPGIHNILGDLPLNRCHWHYVTPASTPWKTLISNAKTVNTNDMATLQRLPGLNRNQYQQYIELLGVLNNFKCEREGCNFECGPVDEELDENWVLAIDGLSGLSIMAMDLVVGAKVIKTQPEWGAAQQMVLKLVQKLCYDTKCNFVLNAHIERQLDELTGGTHKTVSTLGNKLAPELVKPFDEIIYAKRKGEDFVWSTTESGVDLKTRTLGWGDDFPPDYKKLLEGEIH